MSDNEKTVHQLPRLPSQVKVLVYEKVDKDGTARILHVRRKAVQVGFNIHGLHACMSCVPVTPMRWPVGLLAIFHEAQPPVQRCDGCQWPTSHAASGGSGRQLGECP